MGEKSSKPRRRFFRFTLRSFWLVFTIASLWFGWRVNRAHRQRAAVDAIYEFGGNFSYDYEADGSVAFGGEAPVPPEPSWLIDAVGVDLFHRVEYASLLVGRNDVSAEETAKVTAALEDLLHLQTLYLCGEQATDETLARVAKMKDLEELSLGPRMDWTAGRDVFPRITREGLQRLQTLERLCSLSIDGAALDDQSLAALAEITSLESLHLGGRSCYFTDEGVAQLRVLDRLSSLSLAAESLLSEIGDEGLLSLLPMERLHWVKLRGLFFSEAALREVESSVKDTATWKLFDATFDWWVFTEKGYYRKPLMGDARYDPVLEAARERIDGYDKLTKKQQRAALIKSLRDAYFDHNFKLARDFVLRAAKLNASNDESLVDLVRELRTPL